MFNYLDAGGVAASRRHALRSVCESCRVSLTNPLWYLAAFLIAIGSAMGAVIVAAGAFDSVRDATVIPVTERAEASGKTLAVYTDVVQPDRDVTCQATGTDNKPVDIPDKGVDIVATNTDGTAWHLIGLLDEGKADLRIACAPKDKRADNAAYGFAAVTGYSTTVNNGHGIEVLGLAAGAGLAAWVYWCRRKERQERSWTTP